MFAILLREPIFSLRVDKPVDIVAVIAFDSEMRALIRLLTVTKTLFPIWAARSLDGPETRRKGNLRRGALLELTLLALRLQGAHERHEVLLLL
jgi:hypothetical protein